MLDYRRVIEPAVAREAARVRRRADLAAMTSALRSMAKARHGAGVHALRHRAAPGRRPARPATASWSGPSRTCGCDSTTSSACCRSPTPGTGAYPASTRRSCRRSRRATRRRPRPRWRQHVDGQRAGRARGTGGNPEENRIMIEAEQTNVFPRLLDLAYPNIVRGEGVRLYTTDGCEVLDACSGGAMVACLGHGATEIVAGRAGAGGAHLLRLQPPLHQRAAGAPGRAPDRARRPGDGPCAVRLRRVGGQRDGSAARSPVPRRPRRGVALADDHAGTGVPRRADGSAGADRPRRASSARTTSTCRVSCTFRRRPGASTRPGSARSTSSIV